jgi:AraC family transcriptional regulator
MPDLALIARSLDFIEAHLREPIGVADMADAVGYSLYHFSRTFNEATHHTPYDYLMRRRLSEAACILLQSDAKIIDVAFDFQFNNPETFSRAFKRTFDIQPSRLRKREQLAGWHFMPRLTLAHLEQLAKGSYLRPVLVEQAALRLAGLMAVVKEDPADLVELWDLLDRELEDRSLLVESSKHYGIVSFPEDWEERGLLYLAAVEIQAQDVARTNLVLKLLPSLTCARFVHKGTRYELPLTLDYVFHTWLPKSGSRLAWSRIIECHGQHFQAAGDPEAEFEVLIPIV